MKFLDLIKIDPLAINVSKYLPHASPMILLECANNITETYAECETYVSHEGVLSPFLDLNDQLPAWFGVELMAQTIGVWCGFHNMIAAATKEDAKPQIGMLLGARGFKSKMPAFPTNSILKIYVDKILEDDRLANFDCRILIDHDIIATAKLTVYQSTSDERRQLLGEKSL